MSRGKPLNIPEERKLLVLDGPAIPAANWGNSCESIRRRKPCSQRSNDSRESHQTCDSQFSVPRKAIRKKGFSSGTLNRLVRINQFTRICKSIPTNRAIEGGNSLKGFWIWPFTCCSLFPFSETFVRADELHMRKIRGFWSW